MPPPGRSNPGRGFGGPRYPGTFLVALREAFARLGWTATRWLGDAVECMDATGREQVLGLDNLYRRVRPVDRAGWPELLADFLSNLPGESLDVPAGGLDEVADRVLVRLGPRFTGPDLAAELWSQPIAGARVMATLVIDFPSSMSYVTAEMIDASGRPGSYWLERAVENLRQKTPADCLKPVHEDSGLLQSEVADAYDSSRALLIDQLLPGHDRDGFFVAVPGRDHLLVLPVSNRALAFVPWLRTVAAHTHRNLPYPISPEVFWVRGGVWHVFDVDIKGEQVVLRPPDEFIEVLERLTPRLVDSGDEPADGGGVPN